MNFVICINCKV